MPAGNLDNRIAFESRVTLTDEYGNVQEEWSEQIVVWARKQYLVGGETVMASRLDGRQPAALTVRRSPDTAQITVGWRARDVDTGELFNIRSINVTEDRAWVNVLCEKGVPSG